MGLPIWEPITSPDTTNSTRRFCWRPSAESFEAIGADELILHPTITDLDEVGQLADVVLN